MAVVTPLVRHTQMWRKGCRTGKEASHRTGQELVVKSPHSGCIRSLVWVVFFPFCQKNWHWFRAADRRRARGWEEFVLILLINMTPLAKALTQDGHGRVWTRGLPKGLSHQTDPSTANNGSRWLTRPAPLLYLNTKKGLWGMKLIAVWSPSSRNIMMDLEPFLTQMKEGLLCCSSQRANDKHN